MILLRGLSQVLIGSIQRIELIQAERLDADLRGRVHERLRTWLTQHIGTVLEPIVQLKQVVDNKSQTDLTGLARGIGYQLTEHYGVLDRAKVARDIKALAQEDRQQLRRLGVRFGEFSIFMPKLLKPASAHLLLLLWKITDGHRDDALPTPPAAGLCSVPRERDVADAFYVTGGFRPCGKRVVRVDMLERLALLIREEVDKHKTGKAEIPVPPSSETSTTSEQETSDDKEGEKPAPTPEPEPVERIVYEATGAPIRVSASAPRPSVPTPTQPSPVRPGEFLITSDMMSLVGCSGEDFESILRALGFRKRPHKQEGVDEPLEIWKRLPPPGKGGRKPHHKRGPKGKKAKAQGKDKRGGKNTRPKGISSKPKTADPDSPFAALKSLTEKS